MRAAAQALIALLVLGLGAGLAWYLYSQKTSPGRTEAAAKARVVDVVRPERSDHSITVTGYGTIRARWNLALVPQVRGRIVGLHPDFVEGGLLPAGAVVVRIDDTDYRLAAAQAEARISSLRARLARIDSQRQEAEAQTAGAETRLKQVQAEADIAREQFQKLYPDEEPTPLRAKEPQLEEARAQVEAAEARLGDVDSQRREVEASIEEAQTQLEQAETNLERTVVKLPESSPEDDAYYRVRSKQAALGAYAAPGQALGQLYRVDAVEAVVPLEPRMLDRIALPEAVSSDANAQTVVAGMEALPGLPLPDGGAAAVIHADPAEQGRTWPGRVVRVEGEVDPRTRLVNVVVAVGGVNAADELGDLLTPGQFVHVDITGETIEEVHELPRTLLREDGEGGYQVWLAEEGQLRFRHVEVAFLNQAVAYVRGLPSDAAVIATDLDAVSEGQPVAFPHADQEGS
jgi:multidrug efflux pump subunit AcrA (membrane-fusion protein)